ncbi:MAG: nucleotidyltransferase domain-containing protein, partial [Thermodesulfobacteriota bacterium]|nr:nucleotidyltransferase domain-containing protein [Thermodesulfobacteriota bacterium]
MDKIPFEVKKVLSDYIKKLSREINVTSAFVFGSYAKGNWKSDSDIDVAIFSDDFTNLERAEAIAFLLDRTLEYDLDIQPVAFDEDDYINYQDNPFVNEVVTTGIKMA